MTNTLTRQSVSPRANSSRLTASDQSSAGRRNGTRVAIGVVVTVLCVLGVVALLASANDRIDVVSIRHDVAIGQEIRADDIAVVAISANSELRTIAATEQRSVIGKIAAVSLVSGSLLAPSQVSDGPRVPQGMVLSGALLKPGQYPVGLRAGDDVILVEMPSSTATGAAATPIERGSARVLETEQIKDSASTLAVSLIVPAATGAAVASAGASGRLTIVVATAR